MSNSIPPGWYPDPEPAPGAEGATERFWDGTGWTARTRPVAVPPSSAAPAPPAALTTPPSPAPPAPLVAPASARPVAAGPSVPASAFSDASPAYGHPAVPEPVEPGGYGFPPAAAPAPLPPPPPPPPYGYQPPRAGFPPPYGTPTAGYLPPGPAPQARRRTGLIVGILVGSLALIVLAAGISISVLAGSTHSGRPAFAGRPAPARTPSPSPSGPSADAPSAAAPSTGAPSPVSPAPQSTAPVTPDGTAVQDAVHGLTVPLPRGWSSAGHDPASALLMITGSYDCATPGGCVRGSFAVDTGPAAGPDAETVARRTMADYAPQLFGELATHQELTCAPLTAAGLTGYAVRWHVVPKQGAAGFVLLVALPAPGGGFTTVVGSVDDDPRAPQPADLDQIVAGMRSVGAAGAPNGV